MENLITLAQCTRSHGLKGKVCCQLYDYEQEILRENMPVYLKCQKEKRKSKISKIQRGNQTLLTFEAMDLNQVKELLPFEVEVSRKDFPKLNKGPYYLCDLFKFKVYDQKGKLLGRVENFTASPAHLLIEIKAKESFNLPFIAPFLKEIDQKEKKIIMQNPEEIK